MSIAQERDWTLDDVMQLTSEKITDLWMSLPSASLQELYGEYEGHVPMVGADEEFIAQINETMRNEEAPLATGSARHSKRRIATTVRGITTGARLVPMVSETCATKPLLRSLRLTAKLL